MTPEQFIEEHPNWRDDVTGMCSWAIGRFVSDGLLPLPWSDETIEQISNSATEEMLHVFGQYRDQMGDQIFGEFVLFIGEEARRLAIAAREGLQEQIH